MKTNARYAVRNPTSAELVVVAADVDVVMETHIASIVETDVVAILDSIVDVVVETDIDVVVVSDVEVADDMVLVPNRMPPRLSACFLNNAANFADPSDSPDAGAATNDVPFMVVLGALALTV